MLCLKNAHPAQGGDAAVLTLQLQTAHRHSSWLMGNYGQKSHTCPPIKAPATQRTLRCIIAPPDNIVKSKNAPKNDDAPESSWNPGHRFCELLGEQALGWSRGPVVHLHGVQVCCSAPACGSPAALASPVATSGSALACGAAPSACC